MKPTGASVIREVIAAHGREVRKARRRVLSGGSDKAVHDLRVATRRLQAALEVFAADLPERARRRLDRRARNLRRRVAARRNAGVLLRLVARLGGGGDTTEHRFLARLKKRLRRGSGERGAGGRIDLPGIRKRIDALLDGARDGSRRSSSVPARAALARRAGTVLRARRIARGGGPEAMHRLRIGVKRYRYAIEILSEAGAPGLEATIARSKPLQRELGRLHDLDELIAAVRSVRAPGSVEFQRRIEDLRARQARVALRAAAFFHPVRDAGSGSRRGGSVQSRRTAA